MPDTIYSPIRYAGGKFYARQLIVSLLPSHTAYCEPFAGGASIFFAKAKVADNWLNDKDGDLIRLYQVIRDQPEALITFLDAMPPPSKETHTFYKKEYVPQSDLQHAGRWYYLNRISYSGIMNMQNCYWSYGTAFNMLKENWPHAIRAASDKLHGVTLTNEDYESVLDRIEDGTLLFVDPPYFNADQDRLYPMAFSFMDHVHLAIALRRHAKRLSFLLTYDSCPEIRSLYDWVERIDDNEWSYRINRSDDQTTKHRRKGSRGKGKELFIRNYTLLNDRFFSRPI